MITQKSTGSHLLVPVCFIDNVQQDERLQYCPTNHSNPNTLKQPIVNLVSNITKSLNLVP